MKKSKAEAGAIGGSSSKDQNELCLPTADKLAEQFNSHESRPVNDNDLQTMTLSQIEAETHIPTRKLRLMVELGLLPRAPIPGKLIRVFRSDVVKALTGNRTQTEKR